MHTKTINQQKQNRRHRTDSNLGCREVKGGGGGGGGLNAFYWRQIFSIYSVVVKTQKLFGSHELAPARNTNQLVDPLHRHSAKADYKAEIYMGME